MNSTLYGIRAGIRSNITSALGGVNMTGYLMVPPEPPCFEIDFPADSLLPFTEFGKKGGELELIVRGIVALGESDESQALLDSWLTGTNNVASAILSDPTLGGAVAAAHVIQTTGHRRLLTAEGALFLCAEWTVHLILN